MPRIGIGKTPICLMVRYDQRSGEYRDVLDFLLEQQKVYGSLANAACQCVRDHRSYKRWAKDRSKANGKAATRRKKGKA